MKAAVIISAILTILGLAASVFLGLNSGRIGLTSSDLIAHLVQIWLSVAAFISAAFVVTSYIHTNRAFQLSQKPQLLIQVLNEVHAPEEGSEKGQRFHGTNIYYRNVSLNQFEDLGMRVRLRQVISSQFLTASFHLQCSWRVVIPATGVLGHSMS